MKTTVKVKDLVAGDDLGNCVILSSSYYGDYCGSKNRQSVKVKYRNGSESSRLWGRDTTVTVLNRQS